jgi:hypothetical protein
MGIPDVFVEHGSQSLLRSKYRIDEDGIFKEIVEMVKKRSLQPLRSNQNKTSMRRVSSNSK